MPDNYTIADIAAKGAIDAAIAAHVPSLARRQIPDDAPGKLAAEVARAVVDALADAGRLTTEAKS